MKYKIVAGLALLVTVVGIYSCEKNEGIVAITTLSANCDTAGLTFSSGAGAPIQTIINAQCAVSGCHAYGAPKSTGDFSTYAGASKAASGGTGSNMWTRLVGPTSAPMPNIPQAGWNTCDLAKLKQWILIGAPQ